MTLLVLLVDNSLIVSVGTAVISFFSLWIFNREKWKNKD